MEASHGAPMGHLCPSGGTGGRGWVVPTLEHRSIPGLPTVGELAPSHRLWVASRWRPVGVELGEISGQQMRRLGWWGGWAPGYPPPPVWTACPWGHPGFVAAASVLLSLCPGGSWAPRSGSAGPPETCLLAEEGSLGRRGPLGFRGPPTACTGTDPMHSRCPGRAGAGSWGPPREHPVHLVTLALSAGRGLLGLLQRSHSSRGLRRPLCRSPGGSSSRGSRRWETAWGVGGQEGRGGVQGLLVHMPQAQAPARGLRVAPDVGSGFWGAASRHGLVGNAGQSGVGGGQEAWSARQLLGSTALGGSLSGRHIRKNGAWNFLFEKK